MAGAYDHSCRPGVTPGTFGFPSSSRAEGEPALGRQLLLPLVRTQLAGTSAWIVAIVDTGSVRPLAASRTVMRIARGTRVVAVQVSRQTRSERSMIS